MQPPGISDCQKILFCPLSLKCLHFVEGCFRQGKSIILPCHTRQDMPIEEKSAPANMESAATLPKASSSALEKSVSKMSVRCKESEGATASLSLPSVLGEEPQPSTSVAASYRSISGGAKRKFLKRKDINTEKKLTKLPETVFASPPRKRFQYDLSQISRTLEAIQGGMSVRTACDKFQVPRTTIRNKLSNKAPMVSTGHCGPVSLLGEDIEDMLVDWVIGCADMGFQINKDDLLSSVKRFLDEKNIESVHFVNNRPGRRWYEGFYKRHPVLDEKQREERSGGAKRSVTEDEVKEWFQKVRNSLVINVDALNYPDRVFCMDEIVFSLTPPDDPLSEKENISTFFAVNAKGNLVPPLTLFKMDRVPETVPPNWHLGKTEKGLMTGESFYEYFVFIFHQYLNDNNIVRPVVVFLDGRKSHLTLHLSRFCWDQNIILIALPPNSSDILHPLDISVFLPIKKVFKRFLRLRKSKSIKDFDVPVALSRIVTDARMKKNIVCGFSGTGIFPFDENNVDYSKCSIVGPFDQVNTPIEMSQEERNFIKDFSTSLSHKQTKSNDAIIIRPFVQNNSEDSFSMLEVSFKEMDTTTEQFQTHEVTEQPVQKNEVYKYLQFMESRIDSSSLYEFKRTLFNKQEWSGNPHDKSLFQLWKQVTEEALAPEAKEEPIQSQEIHSCQ
ncbi:hypothetical protein JTE90_027577 [Oedothorax gibbosus]|uniref:HTH CENPB-type domain-containing protein n=1 Tax=Oedothorax gibbosus TaxID=931172 RepID=A0AAV6VLD2_9ARAC|nr:hypothetical protein JTE90_027577 [Oedothorax gibbosus]